MRWGGCEQPRPSWRLDDALDGPKSRAGLGDPSGRAELLKQSKRPLHMLSGRIGVRPGQEASIGEQALGQLGRRIDRTQDRDAVPVVGARIAIVAGLLMGLGERAMRRTFLEGVGGAFGERDRTASGVHSRTVILLGQLHMRKRNEGIDLREVVTNLG